MQQFVRVVLLWAAIVFFQGAVPAKSSTSIEVNEWRSALIFRFAHLVVWPEDRFEGEESPIRFGVLGDDAEEFWEFIEPLNVRTIRGRPIEIVPYAKEPDLDQLLKCHIVLVLGELDQSRIGYLDTLNDGGVLTLGDSSDFARSGGMVGVYLDRREKPQIDVNLDLIQHEDLAVSAEALRHVHIVKARRGQKY